MKRYSRNISMLSKSENEKLKEYRVCVIGCGGLGGYIIEMLGRLGIGYITAVDSDYFDETNLNRQILSTTKTIGQSKALVAKERMGLVNPLIEVNPVLARLSCDNISEILNNHDVIVDAVDNIQTRFYIQDEARTLKIPMVHGAIAGWYGQVSTIFPGDDTLDKIYSTRDTKGIEEQMGNPSFTPALVASMQVSEMLKILLGRGELLRNKLLYIDLLENDIMIIDLN